MVLAQRTEVEMFLVTSLELVRARLPLATPPAACESCPRGDCLSKMSAVCALSYAARLLQVKQEMRPGSKRQLALPQSEQEGSDAVEFAPDTRVSAPSIAS